MKVTYYNIETPSCEVQTFTVGYLAFFSFLFFVFYLFSFFIVLPSVSSDNYMINCQIFYQLFTLPGIESLFH